MKKILSLDGGGSWAILQLLTLKERFKNVFPELKGHDILKQFDLVIANSGGSIVLAALVENWSVDKAIELFSDKSNRELIFSNNTFKEMFWPVWFTRRMGIGPKYSTKRKREAFEQLFPNSATMLMSEIAKFIGKEEIKFIVCTYDALNNKAKFFRSYTPPGYDDEFISLVKAIHGSSNAPVQYFDFPARIKSSSGVFYELWDGALGGFNNPVAAGVIEAQRLGFDLDTLLVISLGNGSKIMSNREKEAFYNIKEDTIRNKAKKLKFKYYKSQFNYFKSTILNQAKVILYTPPDWANFVTLSLLSRNSQKYLEASNRIIRLSPLVYEEGTKTPIARSLVNELYEFDMDLKEDYEIEKLKLCFEEWKQGNIMNQPIQYSVDRQNNLHMTFGDTTFSGAINKWS